MKICECSGKSFTNLLFKKRDASGKSKIYVALFLAIWNLKQNGYVINDYEMVASALLESGANGRLSRITEDNSWDSNIRKNAIRYFESILKPVLASVVEITTNYDKQTSRILHVLDKVSDVGIENQMVEFKIGITTLAKNTLNSSVIKKSIQTLVAMSNTVLDDYVYVILGIADNEKSANDFKKHYGVGVAGFGNCLLSGVDAEVEKYYGGSLDNYIKQIQDIISHTHVSDRVKNAITSKISIIKVCGRTLVVLQFKNQNCPTNYDGAFWVRTFNSNKRIELNSEFYFDYVESHWVNTNPA